MWQIKIIREPISRDELRQLAQEGFGDFIKAVVDLEQKIMAIGSELHADEEEVLLEQGSRQADLWGINIYPDKRDEERIEFDSMINLRPSQGNRSRGVQDAMTRQKIQELVVTLIK